MAYQEALEAAGATVHHFREFGSYQGEWWALVTLADGRKGWINGSYGSCSGCDAFQSEFGYSDDKCSEHSWAYGENVPASCAACDSVKAEVADKMRRFGANYLDAVMSQADAEKEAARNLEWDMEANDMVAFLQSHSLNAAE